MAEDTVLGTVAQQQRFSLPSKSVLLERATTTVQSTCFNPIVGVGNFLDTETDKTLQLVWSSMGPPAPASYQDLPVDDEEDDVMVNGGSAHSRGRRRSSLPSLHNNNNNNNNNDGPTALFHRKTTTNNNNGQQQTTTNGSIPYYKTPSLRGDGYGGGGRSAALLMANHSSIPSHNYEPDESEVWRAHTAQVHFRNRGQWWTTGKKRALKRWVLTFIIGVLQGVIAMGCNFLSRSLITYKFDHVYALLRLPQNAAANDFLDSNTINSEDDLLQTMNDDENDASANHASSNGSLLTAYLWFVFYQVLYAAIAGLFVWVEPVSAGSG
jgi:hypothetical protein